MWLQHLLLDFLQARSCSAPLPEPLIPLRRDCLRVIQAIWRLNPPTLYGLLKDILLHLSAFTSQTYMQSICNLLACAYGCAQDCSTAAAHLKYLLPRASTPTSSLLRKSLLKAADALVNNPPRSAMFVKRLLEHQNCWKVLRADHCQACMLICTAYKSLELSFDL